MARNELSKDAMKIADLIYKKASEKTNKEIAEKIGIDPSNLGRFQTNYLEMVCAYLDEIGLSVHVNKTIIVKNTWKNDSAYRGVNTFIQNEDGDVFEMQYYTQQSFDLKNGLLHKLYKQFRNPKTPFHEKEKLLLEMRKLSSKIKVPKGIELIEDKK
ncbi:hypothetical protein [Aggregatibacter actinomycetemcomitans]|uniref:hypothetical protein n=1 Tax=Aggregatibacter actinomycetemcomitans TaxID=714 RepID=UPI00022AC811|nr:hypothetical protein [Aggregatibacter actinomycetemcomitans]KND83609.1 minor head protein [Aggregatibacter actinomycetemcomitans serotype b str. SCC1398]KOE52829.1 minor head protein [Aggregatibacter actinomycetemcomitans serotype b str. SCC4092]